MEYPEVARMRHDDPFRKELVKELRQVETLMGRDCSMEKRIYYFSAAYGATGRAYRYSLSRDVLLADLVLQTTHQIFAERLMRMKGGDTTVIIEELHFQRLREGLTMLASGLEKAENIQGPLEALLVTAHSVTGPGNYLRERGDLQL